MPNIAKLYCEIHNIDKFKDNNDRNVCRLCRYEKRKIYTERNQEYNKKTRNKAKTWLDENRKKNPEKYKNYATKYNETNAYDKVTKRIIRKYGLKLEEYNQFVIDCNNKCNICGLQETRKFLGETRRLFLDHDHKSGKIRGLLCFSCNIGLGKLKDNIKILQAAIDYLKQHEE